MEGVTMNTDYEKLADRAERGELRVKPGTVRRGSEAADEAQHLLLMRLEQRAPTT